MRIAIAGGTGTVGRYVREAAEAQQHQVVIISRSNGVDLQSGKGLEAALEGADVIVDVTNAGTIKREAATTFFTEVARRLQAAGAAGTVEHVVTLSIVGLEKAAGYGYYAAKLAHEEAALRGPVPATILRATQFHEFPAQILGQTKWGPVALVPAMRVQTVAARTVGSVLVDLAAGASAGRAPDLAGPDQADLTALARAVLRHRGLGTVVLPFPVPGAAGKAQRSGALLPGDGARLEGPTFESWLASPDSAAPPI